MGTSHVPIAAFADQRASLWGVLVGGAQPVLALAPFGSVEGFQPLGVSIRGEPPNGSVLDAGRRWEVSAAEIELSLVSSADYASSGDADGLVELCAVRGEIRLSDEERRLECGGARLAADARCESLRFVAGWFESGAAVALVAQRPRDADGHGKDRVAAVLAGEADGTRLFDPRLSTTYGSDGSPRRAGIELWLGEDEDADFRFTRLSLDARSAAGDLSRRHLRIECHALQGHDASSSGHGVYLLVRAV
jgi:hypothetical protein